MLLAGGAETCYQIFAWLVLFSFIPKILFQNTPVPAFKERMVFLILFLVFFVGFSAIQLLPTMELIEISVRSHKYNMEYASRWSLQMRDWLSFVLLDPYGYSAFPRSPDDGQVWMQSHYMGAIPLMLAGIYFLKGGVRVWTFVLIIVVSWGLALGKGSSLYELFYEYLPLFGSFRYPVKFILPIVLVLAIAAGWGWDRLFNTEDLTRLKGVFLAFSTLCMIGFGAIDLFFSDILEWMNSSGFSRPDFNAPKINLSNTQRLLGLTALAFLFLYFMKKDHKKKLSWARAGLFIFFLDIFFSNHGNYEVSKTKHYTEIPPATRFLMDDTSLSRVYVEYQSESVKKEEAKKRFFRGIKIRGTRMPVEFRNQNRIQQLTGWNVISKKPMIIFGSMIFELPNEKRLHMPRMANVKYIVHSGEEPLMNLPLAFEEPSEYRKKLEQEVTNPPPLLRIYKNPGYLSRAFLAGNCIALSDSPQLNNAMLDAKWNPKKWVFLAESPPDLPCIQPPANVQNGEGTVQIQHWKSESGENDLAPGEYRMQINSARKQFLVVSDSYYPGWEALVDGKSVKIYRANEAFRAIVMPAGEHSIEFRYRPKSVRYGAWISGVTLIAGIAFLTVSTRRKTWHKPIM